MESRAEPESDAQSTNFLWGLDQGFQGDGLSSSTFTLVSLSHCVRALVVCLRSWSCWKIQLQLSKVLAFRLDVMPSIFWSPVTFPGKHPHNKVLPPPCFTAGGVLQTKNFTLSPYISLSIIAKELDFSSSDHRVLLQKAGDHLQPSVWLYYAHLGLKASSLYESRSGYCFVGIYIFGTWCLQDFHSSFVNVLGFTIEPFRWKISSVGVRLPLSWMMHCLCICTTDVYCNFSCLESAPKENLDLWTATIFFKSWLSCLDLVLLSGVKRHCF